MIREERDCGECMRVSIAEIHGIDDLIRQRSQETTRLAQAKPMVFVPEQETGNLLTRVITSSRPGGPRSCRLERRGAAQLGLAWTIHETS